MKYQIVMFNNELVFRVHGGHVDCLLRLREDPDRVTFRADEDGTLQEASEI